MNDKEPYCPSVPDLLPQDHIYVIQLGNQLFQVSGYSLLADSPSYFTNFFSKPENASKVLYFDRSPAIFEKIILHLQGYHVRIENEHDYVHLWQDAHYYRLCRLKELLNEEDLPAIIGGRLFKVPRLLVFSDGNHPNFFLIAIDCLFVPEDSDIIPDSLVRPPSQCPTFTTGRSPLLFQDLLEIYFGNPTVIRDDDHRRLLIKECRYFRFLNLEQKIVKHKIVFDPRLQTESIIIDLQALVASGISNCSRGIDDEQLLRYTRPYLAREPLRPLVLHIESSDDSEAKLVIRKNSDFQFLVLTNKLASKIKLVLKDMVQPFAKCDGRRLSLPCLVSDGLVTIDGNKLMLGWHHEFFPQSRANSVEFVDDFHDQEMGDFIDFKIIKSLWTVRMRGNKHVFRLESLTGLTYKNNAIAECEF